MSHRRTTSNTLQSSLHSLSSHRRTLSGTARDLRGDALSPIQSKLHCTFEEKTRSFVSVLDTALNYFAQPPQKSEVQKLKEAQSALERVHQSLLAECTFLRTQVKQQASSNLSIETAFAQLASRFMKIEKSHEGVTEPLDDSLEVCSEADSLEASPAVWMESPRELRTQLHLRSSSGYIRRSEMFA
jgi:hypothetical protein